MSRTRYALALALLLAPLALHFAGCSDRSHHPWGEASAAGGPWLWTPAHGGFPVGERMVRMDSPGGIEAWVPESYLLASQGKVSRYLGYLDTQPNEKGSKTLHDAPGYRVIFVPQVQLIRVGASAFAAGVTQPGSRTIYLAWPPNCGDQAAQDAWIRGLIAHEAAHALGWPGSHPATCPDCMVRSL